MPKFTRVTQAFDRVEMALMGIVGGSVAWILGIPGAVMGFVGGIVSAVLSIPAGIATWVGANIFGVTVGTFGLSAIISGNATLFVLTLGLIGMFASQWARSRVDRSDGLSAALEVMAAAMIAYATVSMIDPSIGL